MTKVSEVTGATLDYWVAKAEGKDAVVKRNKCYRVHPYNHRCHSFMPSTDWAHGGPIIERERIRLMPQESGGTFLGVLCDMPHWLARTEKQMCNEMGETALIAAMRAYVSSKFGDEVKEPV